MVRRVRNMPRRQQKAFWAKHKGRYRPRYRARPRKTRVRGMPYRMKKSTQLAYKVAKDQTRAGQIYSELQRFEGYGRDIASIVKGRPLYGKRKVFKDPKRLRR